MVADATAPVCVRIWTLLQGETLANFQIGVAVVFQRTKEDDSVFVVRHGTNVQDIIRPGAASYSYMCPQCCSPGIPRAGAESRAREAAPT
eukprot:7816008-Pyramimonas_sp.AAC.1